MKNKYEADYSKTYTTLTRALTKARVILIKTIITINSPLTLVPVSHQSVLCSLHQQGKYFLIQDVGPWGHWISINTRFIKIKN